MRNPQFKTKEEYLAYRSAWKAEYKQLSYEIRETKKDIRELMRNREYAGGLQSSLIRQRAEATAMLEELKLAKVEAQRQYLAAKAQLQLA
jgi:hypothetical protein